MIDPSSSDPPSDATEKSEAAGDTSARGGTPIPSESTITGSFTMPPEVPRAERPVPESFGRYRIVRQLGAGGMGTVYLAHDSELDRLVALKVPRLGPGERSQLRERFTREARAAALLHHPNICPVFDVGVFEDIPYLTMAYIEGQPLHEWARGRPLPTLLAVIRTLALALDEAHQKGVVHRDLKPSNVLVDRRGEPVVMDFGLARRLSLAGEDRLTQAGMLLGTPAYMPPEHVSGERDTAQAAGDIYSLGVILFDLLAGRLPYVGSVGSVLAQILTDEPPPLSRFRADLDPRLEVICKRAMARDPRHRFARMADLAAALEAVLADSRETQNLRRGASPTLQVTSGQTVVAEPPAPQMVGRVLELLRRWGWGQAMQKIRWRAQRGGDPERAAWQRFYDRLGGEHADDPAGSLPEEAVLRGWALVGRASYLFRERSYYESLRSLERAEAVADREDRALQATLAHTRGSLLVHLSKCDEALGHLHRALELFGRDHFMTGRVLDTLGMAYAGKGNFPVAREFYEQSIRYKKSSGDDAGIAISHGQLGRLNLEWGHLDEAERHFQEDLRLVQRSRSRRSEAQIYDHLGQVALARGEREAAAGKRAAARRHFGTAAGWLGESIRLCEEGGYAVAEGFARKDRALVHLAEGDLEGAETQARRALELFAASQFREGVAKVQLVEASLLRARGSYADAERKLRGCVGQFESMREQDAVVRTHWEIARTLRDAGAATPLITRAYREALQRAEAYRHAPLVRDIEQELREVDFETYLRHVYRRARGLDIDEDDPTLLEGTSEVASVVFVDLPDFTEFAHGLDAEAVLLTYNQLMADFSEVLGRHQASVTTYRGSGLMALVREARHAERAVLAALEVVSALEEFNWPRELLGLPQFHARISVNSGDVLLGNVGSYRKMDFTAIGATVNLAGASRNVAQPGVPCLTRATYELVRERFRYQANSPRLVEVSGFGPCEVWDVVGRARE